MTAYVGGSDNPSLLREYDRKKAQNAAKSADAPKQRPDESESEYAERVKKYVTVAQSMDQL